DFRFLRLASFTSDGGLILTARTIPFWICSFFGLALTSPRRCSVLASWTVMLFTSVGVFLPCSVHVWVLTRAHFERRLHMSWDVITSGVICVRAFCVPCPVNAVRPLPASFVWEQAIPYPPLARPRQPLAFGELRAHFSIECLPHLRSAPSVHQRHPAMIL